jgi:predicted flap endonuclease-1-like 5' DNA nuclease
MTNTEMIWLRGQAAQRDVLHLVSYGTAFFGTAALQAVHLGLTVPRVYLAALSRAAARTPAPPADVIPIGQGMSSAAMPEPMPAPIPAPEPTLGSIAAVDADSAADTTLPSPHLLDAPRDGVGDDLTLLKGVGPKLAEALKDFGIFHFDQIASLDEEGIAWLDAQQKGFRMICARHDIVAQARAMI